jgi:Fe-S cluster assembly protein SufD
MSTSSEAPKVVLDPSMTRVENAVPVQTRSERFHSTDPEAFPTVTGREPEWRLSPVKKLTALITGPLDGSAYDIDVESADNATVEFVDSDSAGRGGVAEPEDRLAANAWSQVGQTLKVSLTGDAGLVRVTRSVLGNTPRAGHTIVHLASGASATLILESSGQALLAENVEIALEKGASLQMVSVQEWDDDAIHYASHFAQIGEGASLTHIVATMGGEIVVVNPSLELAGEGSNGEAYGVYFAESHQHIESRVYVHHVGPDTTSNVSYKGALHGEGARTVWVGDVLIGADATGTDSYEQNRNLVLSDGTRADSIPNLEIKTGDIAGAGHASATGRFDDEHLFYLQSRGIPEIQARRLVVGGFLGEIVQKIDDEAVQERLLERIQQKLRDTEENQ